MPVELTPSDHQFVLHEPPIDVFIGDQVRFVLTDWYEGEVSMSGEIVALRPKGRVKVRVVDATVLAPIAALQVIERRVA